MNAKKLRGLFINCAAAQCSIYESGRMTFQCLAGSPKFALEYIEITPEKRTLPSNFDFYFFNYHITTMNWLDAKKIKNALPGIKMTVVLEVAPNNPFVYCSPEDFDAYCVLDPTLNIADERVFAFPRPLEISKNATENEAGDIPVIGSFGFATEGKGFDHLIDAVNSEFDRAVVRINIPYATYANESHKFAEELAEICRRRAKAGIEVKVTHDFMTKPELIEWCARNTINCFLYDRNMPGLAATTDQAIASGKPLAVSKNNTFRHVQKFIKPFPYQTLKDAIEKTPAQVAEIQREWSPEKFRTRFEAMLDSFDFSNAPQSSGEIELPLKKEAENEPRSLLAKVKSKLRGLKKIAATNGKHQPSKDSYSQFGEDRIVDNLREDLAIKNFSYLDIGANNPQFISNTFLFYEKGMRGVLIEPNRSLCGKLKRERPEDTILNVGIGTGENQAEADFYQFGAEADGLSTFSKTEAEHWETVGMNGKKFKVEQVLRMPLLNVNHVVENYFTECPDFVSIDVEGWDLQILETFDFERFAPAIFCVETLAYKPDGSTYRLTEINEFFEKAGYFSFAETYANNIFVNRNLYDFYLYQKEQKAARETRARISK